MTDEIKDMFEMVHMLIQEAKGYADDQKGGLVTNHLDDAENWLYKIESALGV